MSSIEAVRILDKLKTQNNPTINQFVAIPFTSSNSVILSANKLITQNVKSTLEALDKDDPQQIQYIGSTIPALKAEGLPKRLEKLEGYQERGM